MAEDDGFDLEKPARELTKGVLRGVWDWFLGRNNAELDAEKPKRGILILGPGGTGKTTLARLLSGQLDWLDDEPGRYRESVDLEYFSLSDDSDVEVVVAPGQAYRRPSTWPELLTQVAGGAFRGVIVMNAYGYHTFSTPSYKNHQLYSGSKPEFLKLYFADRRADELRVLRQLVPHLAVCSQKVWLLSAVSKQDLWGSQQGVVEEHYQRGDYSVELAPVLQALGNRSFRHEVVLLSLTIRNLQTLAHETLAETEAGYDIKRLTESIQNLVRIFNGLREWEGAT